MNTSAKILCVSFALVGAVLVYGLFSVELNSLFASNVVTSSSSSSSSNTSTASASNTSTATTNGTTGGSSVSSNSTTNANSTSNANTTSQVTVIGNGSGSAGGTANASGSASGTASGSANINTTGNGSNGTNNTSLATNSSASTNATSNASATSYASAAGGDTSSNLSVTCSASPSTVKVGQAVTWNAYASGGNGSYAYSWTYDITGSGSSVSRSYSDAGTKWAKVTVTSGSKSASAECTVSVQNETTNPNPALECANGTTLSLAETWRAIEVTKKVKVNVSISGEKGNATVENNTGCALPVSLASYSMYHPSNLDTQKFYDEDSVTVPAHSTRTLSVWTGSCKAQVDLYYGLNAPRQLSESNRSADGRTLAWAFTSLPLCQNNPQPTNLSASCTVSASSAYVGDSVSWNVNATGGTGNYAYSWEGSDGISSSNQSFSKTFNTPGLKAATVRVTSGSSSATAQCSVTIQERHNPQPNLSVSCAANPSTARVGQTVVWTANASGGAGNYQYAWSYDVSGNGQSVSRAYNESGTKWARVIVTSNGQTASNECTVRVEQHQNPDPTLDAYCSASPSSVRIGQNTTWTAYPSGGTGSYTYEWSGDASGSSKSVDRSYGTTGNKTATVKITSGSQSVMRDCPVYVYEQNNDNDLDGYCRASDTYVREGDRITWQATVWGGNGNYTYDWSGSDGLSGSGSSVSQRYDDEGRVRATVEIRSNGKTITRDCYADVEEEDDDDEDDDDDNLRASCRASDRTIYVGDNVTFRASVSGGSGSYDYEWSGDRDSDDELDDADSRSITVSYDTPGEKEARVRVESRRDSDTARCSVTVRERGTNYVPPTYVPPTQQPGGVYLSQVPYTGAGDGLKIALFVLSLLVWSGIVSYVLVKRKADKEGVPVTTVLRRYNPASLISFAHSNSYAVPTIREVNESRNPWDIIRERKNQG